MVLYLRLSAILIDGLRPKENSVTEMIVIGYHYINSSSVKHWLTDRIAFRSFIKILNWPE
jgi:hypothetical protein